MGDLFHDPVGWAGTMVDSWLSFAVFAVLSVSAIGFTVYLAAFKGWHAALGPALFVGAFSFTCCTHCVASICSYDAAVPATTVWPNPPLTGRAGTRLVPQ